MASKKSRLAHLIQPSPRRINHWRHWKKIRKRSRLSHSLLGGKRKGASSKAKPGGGRQNGGACISSDCYSDTNTLGVIMSRQVTNSMKRINRFFTTYKNKQGKDIVIAIWYLHNNQKNMENHALGFFMKNIVFHIYFGITEYTYTV